MDIPTLLDRIGTTRAGLARAIGITRAATHQWRGEIPAERVPKISEVYGIPMHELRGDLWKAPGP